MAAMTKRKCVTLICILIYMGTDPFIDKHTHTHLTKIKRNLAMRVPVKTYRK